MGALMSSKACRWSGVGRLSLLMWAPPAKTMVLRVRVASSSRRVAKLCMGAPLCWCWRDALASADWERRAGATGSARPGGCSSVKHSGAQALRRCQIEIGGQHADEHVGTDPVLGEVVDRPQVQVDRLQGAEVPLDNREALVGRDEVPGASRARPGVHACADDIDAVERGLGVDPFSLAARKAEAVVSDHDLEVLGHLVAVDKLATDANPDLVGAFRRPRSDRQRQDRSRARPRWHPTALFACESALTGKYGLRQATSRSPG